MAEDNLDILDVEHAILNGKVARIEKDAPRGTKYEKGWHWMSKHPSE
ncbi:MAG TPA: hypothetical protein VNO70_20430 [Blastocatellia bacterium]|nr:hypothetical protein [Blastocatellia bacterium]